MNSSTNNKGILYDLGSLALAGAALIGGFLMDTSAMLKPGDVAPDFTAVTTDGTAVKLSDYTGKSYIVIFFYPRDNTGGCTREACEFRDARADYQAANAVVFGVSTDDQASHQDFTARNNLNFPLLVDTDHAICTAFGVPVRGDMASRVTFLIGLDGHVANVWPSVNPTGHAAQVLEAIKNLTPAK